MPSRIAAGSFRDPMRAFQFEGSWYIGVGCGNSVHVVGGGAEVCLFKAKDDTLASFTDAGTVFTVNETFGSFDGNVVWNRTRNVSLNMMECPDLFQVSTCGRRDGGSSGGGGGSDSGGGSGGRGGGGGGNSSSTWVLFGSMAHSGGPNQWWTGSLAGTPPRFTPNNVGLLDFGNGYAAKSGSTLVQTSSSRRVVFGFTGWNEPTAPQGSKLQSVQADGEMGRDGAVSAGGGWGRSQPGCGRYLVLPRELTVQEGAGVQINPVPETRVLRVAGSAVHGVIGDLNRNRNGPTAGPTAGPTSKLVLATGAQVEVEVTCNRTGGAWPRVGKVAVRTLGSADGKHYTEVGWDFSHQANGTAFYVDHTHCCRNASTIVQRAFVPNLVGAELRMRVFVDAGMIEAFGSGVVITALVNPDSSAAGGGLPEARVSWVPSNPAPAGVRCAVSSYKLSL